ncbi:MAG TPA: AMMECR1 domain-containing protein [Spirochaetota bacterium]|nr:AMMECR1 domain-containing protein [Spirochaetota bacterium]HNT11376.1 AMMECR1 domain-containing protein [Spirochaetota bacterium]
MNPHANVRRIVIALLAVGFVSIAIFAHARDGDALDAWARFARSAEAARLLAWVRCHMREEVAGLRCSSPGPGPLPEFRGRLGVFITITTKKTVRGCYGAFDHAGDDIASLLREYLRGALFSDPRTSPLGPGEIDAARIIVTVADRPVAIRDINMLDITRYGVTITDESDRTLVFVPAEIKSVAHVQRRIAGMRIAHIAAFRAITIRERSR